MAINILVWAVALASHAACKSFGSLFAGEHEAIKRIMTKSILVRFIMGICEGSITAGFMISTSMFYTRTEQSVRVGYWCKCCCLSCIATYLLIVSLDEWRR